MQIGDFSFVVLLDSGSGVLVLLWELHLVQDLGLDSGLSLRISNRQVASGEGGAIGDISVSSPGHRGF